MTSACGNGRETPYPRLATRGSPWTGAPSRGGVPGSRARHQVWVADASHPAGVWRLAADSGVWAPCVWHPGSRRAPGFAERLSPEAGRLRSDGSQGVERSAGSRDRALGIWSTPGRTSRESGPGLSLPACPHRGGSTGPGFMATPRGGAALGRVFERLTRGGACEVQGKGPRGGDRAWDRALRDRSWFLEPVPGTFGRTTPPGRSLRLG